MIVRDLSAGKGKFSADMGTSQEVRNGDLVFCLFDVPETPRTVGLSHHNGMITGAYTVFEYLGVGVPEYFEHFYKVMDDHKLLSPLYSGLRNTIPADRFLSTKTPQPPPDEQAAIVRFLDYANGKIEQAIRSKRKLIALLNEQKQAIIHRAVTRGLDPSVKLKPSGIPWLDDVPEHWTIKRAKYLFQEVDERSTTGDEELLSVSHITGVTPRSQKMNITMFKAASNVGHKICRPGDLVVNTMWAWMAALGTSRLTGLVSPSYAVYRPRAAGFIDGPYIDALLHTTEYRAGIRCRSIVRAWADGKNRTTGPERWIGSIKLGRTIEQAKQAIYEWAKGTFIVQFDEFEIDDGVGPWDEDNLASDAEYRLNRPIEMDSSNIVEDMDEDGEPGNEWRVDLD